MQGANLLRCDIEHPRSVYLVQCLLRSHISPTTPCFHVALISRSKKDTMTLMNDPWWSIKPTTFLPQGKGRSSNQLPSHIKLISAIWCQKWDWEISDSDHGNDSATNCRPNSRDGADPPRSFGHAWAPLTFNGAVFRPPVCISLARENSGGMKGPYMVRLAKEARGQGAMGQAEW